MPDEEPIDFENLEATLADIGVGYEPPPPREIGSMNPPTGSRAVAQPGEF